MKLSDEMREVSELAVYHWNKINLSAELQDFLPQVEQLEKENKLKENNIIKDMIHNQFCIKEECE